MESKHKKHAVVGIVAREELPGKSKIFRVHLNAPSLQSDEVTIACYADEIVNDRNFGNKKSLFTR